MSLNLESSLAESTLRLAKFLQQKCRASNLKVTFAESCTGGLASAFMTEIEGSSEVFEQSYVTYSNAAKIDMLSVQSSVIDKHGAVSEQVAIEMLQGALDKANADLGVAITGIAGPGGAVLDKPVGTVCFAFGNKKGMQSATELFEGDRINVRQSAVNHAFQKLLDQAK